MQVIVFHRNHTVRKAVQPKPMASTVKVETKEAQTKDSSLLLALLPSDKLHMGKSKKHRQVRHSQGFQGLSTNCLRERTNLF